MAGAHLMWKFCTLTFLYGAVFLWHQRRSPSLAEVSAKHTRTVSTGSDKILRTRPSGIVLLVPAKPSGEATRHSSSSERSNGPSRSRRGQSSADPNHPSKCLAPRSHLLGSPQEVVVTGQCQGLNLCHVSDHKACAFNCQNTTSHRPQPLLNRKKSQQGREHLAPTTQPLPDPARASGKRSGRGLGSTVFDRLGGL